MPAQWTANLVGQMHLLGIKSKELAEKVGWHEKYLSAVLNGKRNPKNAEEQLFAALDELISEKEAQR